MNRYESYKDSGVEWLGEIPSHWEVKRLATIGRFSTSGIDKLVHKNESLVKIVNYTDVYKNKRYKIDSNINFMEVTTPESNRIKHLVSYGDLIYLPSSETFDDLGLSALIDEDIHNLSFSYHVLRFKFDLKSNIYHEFKKYMTNNSSVLKYFSSRGTGSIRKTLSRNDFRNAYIALPPLSEQQKIAQYLDDKTAKIDQAIMLEEKQIELLKEHKQILIQNAVTKGLNPHVKFKHSGVEWIGEVPEHWVQVALKFTLAMPITDGPHETPEFLPEGIPFLSAEAVKNDRLDFDKKRGYISEKDDLRFSKKYKPRRGDVYMVKSGATTGNVAKVETDERFNIWSPLAAMRPNLERIKTDFLFYSLKSNYFFISVENKWSYGTQQNLGMGVLSNIKILLPPISEQTTIANYLDQQTAKIDHAIQLKQQQIDKLKEYKTVLINDVVTGKVKIV